MPRYFLELAYRGTEYSGFQKQENAITIQSEVEKAFQILQKDTISFTGSSRTDAGVHALQNFFHFDFEHNIHTQFIYKMNAILPADIVIKNLYKMHNDSHCRFDAISRDYQYKIYQKKNPFLQGLALYYPFKLEFDKMKEAAELLMDNKNFYAFSKTNTQVKNFDCTIYKSEWIANNEGLTYNIVANRFLRGMVRSLTASMLQVGRGKLSVKGFKNLFGTTNKCAFSVPSEGLFLKAVAFPENYFVL